MSAIQFACAMRRSSDLQRFENLTDPRVPADLSLLKNKLRAIGLVGTSGSCRLANLTRLDEPAHFLVRVRNARAPQHVVDGEMPDLPIRRAASFPIEVVLSSNTGAIRSRGRTPSRS